MPWLLDTLDKTLTKGATMATTISDTTSLVKTGSTVVARDTTSTLVKSGTTTIVDAAAEETNAGSDATTQTVNEDAGMNVSFKLVIKGGLLGGGAPPPLCA